MNEVTEQKMLIRVQGEIDALEQTLGSRGKASAAIIHRVAALSILSDAKWRLNREDARNTSLYFEQTSLDRRPPYFLNDNEADPIELTEVALASFERAADSFFVERDTYRIAGQTRWRQVLEWFRQELYLQSFTATFITEDGEPVDIPRGQFANDTCEKIFLRML